jgi:hypothetical protein
VSQKKERKKERKKEKRKKYLNLNPAHNAISGHTDSLRHNINVI